MKIFNIIFIIFSLLLISCKKDKKSQVFQDYLSKQFKLTIPEQEATFLLIPNNQCGNCFATFSHSSTLKKGNTFIITSLNPAFFSKYNQVFFDSTNELLTLDFINYSTTLVKTKNGSINSVENNIDLFEEPIK